MTRMLRQLGRALRLFRRDESGSALLFVGLGLFTLLAATGIAIDMSRLQSVQAKLSQALDAAGLAAGAKAHSSDPNEVVNNYLNANYPEGYLRSRITDVSVTMNPDNTIITLSATAEVDMTFMQVFGIGSQTVSASSEITRENRGLELVMVLDVTGSMYTNNQIGSLRIAANDLIDILFGQRESMDNLWVGIVPYVTAVNIGAHNTAWLRDYDETRYPPNYPVGQVKWKGCVEERGQWPETNGYDLTDDPPVPGNPETLFPMYFWASNTDNQWINPANGQVSLNQTVGYTDTGGRGPNIGCGEPITPMISSKSQLHTAITGLNAWRRSGTASSTGMAWGWRMLSPKWRGYWNHGDPSLPLDYGAPLMNKAVIIMTDGINQFFSPYSNPPGGSDYTSYGRIQEQRLGAGVTTMAQGLTAINNRFSTLCNRMKAEGILVYSITFGLGSSTAHNNARTLFRNCATHPDYYFDSPDGATLRQAFRTIGDSLANLMISR